MNTENHVMQMGPYLENVRLIKEYCDSSLMDENITCDGHSICLPWKQYNVINKTWITIISNQTHPCNPVNCEKSHDSICNNRMYWSSTSSSISIYVDDGYSKDILLLFYNKFSMCRIIEICGKCLKETERIKNLFQSCNLTQNITKQENNVYLSDLKANEIYNFYLIPIINNETIQSIGKLRIKTKIKAPENVTVTEITSNSISMKWENNLNSSQLYFEIEINSEYNKYFRTTNSNDFTFNQLAQCRRYCFVVSSTNENREVSEKSKEICGTTKHEFSKVEILPVKSELSTFRFIKWRYNNIYGCPLSFSVDYDNGKDQNETETGQTYVNLTELEKNKLYYIKVKPYYGMENGEISMKEFFTKEIDDLVEDYLKTKGILQNAITSITIEKSPNIGSKKLFNIPLFEESSITNVAKALKENFEKNSKQIKIETNYSKNKISFVITITENYFRETLDFILNLMNQENFCLVVKNCTTCKTALHETLNDVMSSMKESGIVFCKEAHFIETAFLVSHIHLIESKPNNFVSIYSINLSYNENSGTLQNTWLLGLVVILLLIILILMADKKGVISIDELLNIFHSRKCTLNNARNSSSENDSLQLKVQKRIPDPNHPHYKLIEEFQKICQESLILEKSNFTSKVAVLPENMKRNRFKNILPYDQTRVVLQNLAENSDYINASHIPFIDNREITEYIAAQGPLKNTITDFWYMVWEQNISIIVMLTKVYEGVQLKCEQYWPLLLNTEFTFDENLVISIIMEEEIKNNSFCERKLKIINRDTNEERRITQIHVLKWNDFSKPENLDFEECLTRFHEITAGNNFSPYLIHCSAGVGRTGTFIALDRLIKKVVKENVNLKIYDVVLELRKYRQNMVQQESQYIFIHDFLDYFMCKFKRQSVECQYDNDFTEIPLN